MPTLDILTYDSLIAGAADLVTDQITIGKSQTILRGDIVVKDGATGTYLRPATVLATEIPVAGSNTYTLTTNFVANDTVVFDGVTFTATADTQNTTNFVVGATIAESMTNLATALNANTTVNATYTASAANGVITITEKVIGGGNTPGTMTTTGTGVISAGTAKASKAFDSVEVLVAAEDVTTDSNTTTVSVGYRAGEFNEYAMRFGGSSTADDNRAILADKSIYMKKIQKA